MNLNTIQQYNVLNIPWPIPDSSIDCCITSPPYWGLRDYGFPGQIGLETTPELFVRSMVKVFEEVRRILKPEGSLWLNLGDSYAAHASNKTFDQVRNASSIITGISNQMAGAKTINKLTEGLKAKDLVGIPWMVAFALRSAGWYLRQDIIWAKPNPMPESVSDRCTKSHEYIFLLSKSPRYYFNADAIKEPMAAASVARLSQDIGNQKGSARVPNKTNGNMKAVQAKGNRKTFRGGGRYTSTQSFDNSTPIGNDSIGNRVNDSGLRNKRSVWNVATQGFSDAHFATFPEELITPCVLAGSLPGGIIFDPFMGAGTTALVALSNGRKFFGFELNPDYVKMAEKRLRKALPLFYTPNK